MSTINLHNLADISMESGLARDADGTYRPFITVRAKAEDGDVMAGQLNPGEVRKMAMQFLEVAEAADQDKIVMTMLTRDVGLAPEVAVNFIGAMRNERVYTE